MDLFSFWLGAKYGKANKKGKGKILATIGIFLLLSISLILLFFTEYLLLAIILILALFLYLKYIRD